MWILAIVLMLLFAAIGFAKGAIRASVSLVGVVLGLLLCVPLSGVIRPIMGPIGVQNPVWLAVIPPIVMFFIIYFIFVGISFFVHHKVNLYYKYKRDDADRIRWERVNRHTGVAVGLLTGAIYFFALAALIYSAGYLTVQLSAEENNPAFIKFVNTARTDMESSGIDDAIAALDPGTPLYYDAADVFGLLYHNPLLQSRLATYPYFLELSFRPEFQEMATDKEYNDLVFGKAPVTQIIAHPRTQAILSNAELMNYLKETDVEDLKTYLRTGKSPKYDEEEILGLWDLDKEAIVTHIRKTQPDIRSRELKAIRMAIGMLPDISLAATPEKRVIFSLGSSPAPAAETPPDPAAVDPSMQMYQDPRYQMQAPPAQQPPPQQAPAEAPPQVVPKFEGEGTWDEELGQYVIKAPDQSGKEQVGRVRIRGDEMELTVAGQTLVFIKQ